MGGTRKVKVLLIDDNEVVLAQEYDVLTKHGFDVRSASTMEVFEKYLKEWTPDIVLTDVDMPGLTGVELCKHLKRSYDSAHIPIVLFSHLSDAALAELAESCEADAYLSKSEDLTELANAVRELCEQVLW